jgi:hypothetical protein
MAPRPLNRKNIQGPETYKERKELDQRRVNNYTYLVYPLNKDLQINKLHVRFDK